MKKEFRAIAMRFNEQNWSSIVGKIESAGISHNIWGGGDQYYLCNNWGVGDNSDGLSIGNCSRRHSNINIVDKVYEEWDEAVFLEACGIDAEFDTFIITREQILQLDKSAKNETSQLVSADLMQWFPKAFGRELKVGVWYTRKTFGRFMFRFSGGYGNGATYGFDYDGVFSERVGVHKVNPYEQATRQEIRQALIEEAKRRGVWDVPMVGLSGEVRDSHCFASVYDIEQDVLWSSYGRVYENGEWATALGKAMTKSEIEQELGYKIEIL